MKLPLIISAILGIALQSATADGEVGRYQLIAAHVDMSGGTTETLYRIDTATGETCRLVESTVSIPEGKRGWFNGSKTLGCEGWMRIENSLQEATTNAQKSLDSMPEKAQPK